MSCAREASKVWMRKTMKWGAWVFGSAVRAERESVAVRYVVGWLFDRDAISLKRRKIASSSTVKTVAMLRWRYKYVLSPIEAWSIVYFRAICKAIGFWYWIVISWKRARKMRALVDFMGNFVRSRFMFGLGIAHGGIAGIIINKQWNLNSLFSWWLRALRIWVEEQHLQDHRVSNQNNPFCGRS